MPSHTHLYPDMTSHTYLYTDMPSHTHLYILRQHMLEGREQRRLEAHQRSTAGVSGTAVSDQARHRLRGGRGSVHVCVCARTSLSMGVWLCARCVHGLVSALGVTAMWGLAWQGLRCMRGWARA